MPLAVINQSQSGNTITQTQLAYIHGDHLNTPRIATDQTGQTLWQWQSTAFGEDTANDDVDGDGQVLALNLRFPGQYYDQESGLHYNYFRDYDAKLGRYLQSDPIGLQGGLNTYAYALNNPQSFVDPLGLETINLLPPNSIINSNASGIQGPSGQMWVLSHGSQLMQMSPQQFVDFLSDNGWHDNMPITLLACNAGEGENSWAQQVAGIANTSVSAPNTSLTLQAGKWWPTHFVLPFFNYGANMVTFQPGGSSSLSPIQNSWNANGANAPWWVGNLPK